MSKMTDRQIKSDTIESIDQSSTNEHTHTHTHTELDTFIYEKINHENFQNKQYLELKLCHSFKLALDLQFVG
jgi:hypothetical protein